MKIFLMKQKIFKFFKQLVENLKILMKFNFVGYI